MHSAGDNFATCASQPPVSSPSSAASSAAASHHHRDLNDYISWRVQFALLPPSCATLKQALDDLTSKCVLQFVDVIAFNASFCVSSLAAFHTVAGSRTRRLSFQLLASPVVVWNRQSLPCSAFGITVCPHLTAIWRRLSESGSLWLPAP